MKRAAAFALGLQLRSNPSAGGESCGGSGILRGQHRRHPPPGPNRSDQHVAVFPIKSASFLSFAVSPDGQKLIAIVFNTPTVINPMPPFGTDPFVATSHWTLDVETAISGAPTT
jgi:hypothetical protein